MRLSKLLARAAWILTVIAAISTTYIYLYPAFHRCGFAAPPAGHGAATKAPLRLLAFGDPQLEGDTSLPNPDDPLFPRLSESWRRIQEEDIVNWPEELSNATLGFFTKDVPRFVHAQRKRLDLWGNDFYLAHIYRTVHWWTQPTHVVVLGDLLGSQWINDEEFHDRADRYWHRVFRGARQLPEHFDAEQDAAPTLDWTKTLINVAGNHDIGYAGDFDTHRKVRFENRFAPLNWDLVFRLDGPSQLSNARSIRQDQSPRVKIVILNSMNLDSPAYNKELQQESKDFLERQVEDARSSPQQDAVVLLTHIPLHKEEGLCMDGPFFNYFPEDQGSGVSEQNHLSEETSQSIIDGLFMVDPQKTEQGVRSGIILNGHDHEGCHVWHTLPMANLSLDPGQNVSSLGEWTSVLNIPSGIAPDTLSAVREVTVRSMMGSYGGNAALISGWFDSSSQRWVFEYQSCTFGVQHIWWAVHIMILVAAAVWASVLAAKMLERSQKTRRRPAPEAKKNQ